MESLKIKDRMDRAPISPVYESAIPFLFKSMKFKNCNLFNCLINSFSSHLTSASWVPGPEQGKHIQPPCLIKINTEALPRKQRGVFTTEGVCVQAA